MPEGVGLLRNKAAHVLSRPAFYDELEPRMTNQLKVLPSCVDQTPAAVGAFESIDETYL